MDVRFVFVDCARKSERQLPIDLWINRRRVLDVVRDCEDLLNLVVFAALGSGVRIAFAHHLGDGVYITLVHLLLHLRTGELTLE